MWIESFVFSKLIVYTDIRSKFSAQRSTFIIKITQKDSEDVGKCICIFQVRIRNGKW